MHAPHRRAPADGRAARERRGLLSLSRAAARHPPRVDRACAWGRTSSHRGCWAGVLGSTPRPGRWCAPRRANRRCAPRRANRRSWRQVASALRRQSNQACRGGSTRVESKPRESPGGPPEGVRQRARGVRVLDCRHRLNRPQEHHCEQAKGDKPSARGLSRQHCEQDQRRLAPNASNSARGVSRQLTRAQRVGQRQVARAD
jgi:hypothetical protein